MILNKVFAKWLWMYDACTSIISIDVFYLYLFGLLGLNVNSNVSLALLAYMLSKWCATHLTSSISVFISEKNVCFTGFLLVFCLFCLFLLCLLYNITFAILVFFGNSMCDPQLILAFRTFEAMFMKEVAMSRLSLRHVERVTADTTDGALTHAATTRENRQLLLLKTRLSSSLVDQCMRGKRIRYAVKGMKFCAVLYCKKSTCLVDHDWICHKGVCRNHNLQYPN